MTSLRIYAFTSSRWFWGKFIFCNNFITFRASAPHKSISCRWECFTQWHFHSKLLHNMLPSSSASTLPFHATAKRKAKRKRGEKSGAYSWCFDKAKCHWETKILLKASFTLFPQLNPSSPLLTLTHESCVDIFVPSWKI